MVPIVIYIQIVIQYGVMVQTMLHVVLAVQRMGPAVHMVLVMLLIALVLV